MKSTIVIYGHESKLTKADAKRIANLLKAQITCTHHIGNAIMKGIEKFVLCLPSLNAEGADREWQEFIDTFRSMNLTGKSFALYVPSDSPSTNKLDELKYVLFLRGARRIVNPPIDLLNYDIDNWIYVILTNL